MNSPVTLITGGSGYIGSALLQALLATGQAPIVAARPSALQRMNLPNQQLRTLDLSVNQGFDSATDGVGTIVHCAGLAHNRGKASDYNTINTLATVNLATAALNNGVRHFIFVSTVNVVPASVDDPCASTRQWVLPVGPYARSKAQAEQALEDIFRNTKCHLTILRPALVYDKTLTASLLSLATIVSKIPVLLPPLGHRLMISRPDLVRLLVNLIHQPPLPLKGGQENTRVVLAADGQRYSARRIGRALSTVPRNRWGFARVPLPASIWRLLAGLRDKQLGVPLETTWQSLAGQYWCPPETVAMPPIADWAPSHTLETLIQTTSGSPLL